MTALEHARYLASRLDTPFWTARLVHAATEKFGAYVPVAEAQARAGALVAAGEDAELARLATLLELGPPRRAEAERVRRLVHGPTRDELEWEAHEAELAALVAELEAERVETTTGSTSGPELPEAPPETIADATSGPELPEAPPETIADATSGPALGPLSDWNEDEIRADWRGMSATERRIFREAIEQAKGNVPDQLTAARYAHRKVLDHRLRRVA